MTRYDEIPGHPLAGVPQEVLNAARNVLIAATHSHDVDAEQAEPIADAVVAALHEAGFIYWSIDPVTVTTECAGCGRDLPLATETFSLVRWDAKRQGNVLVSIHCGLCYRIGAIG